MAEHDATPTPASPAAAPTADPDEYIVLRRSHLVLTLVPLAFVVGVAAGYLFWGRDRPATAAAPPTGQASGPPRRFEVSVDDDPSLGPADAPITIVEFSDFNCRFCRQFHEETFGPLLAAYPDQIRFVYRDFPITSPESLIAAQAANCAGAQRAYWEFHDALFSGGLGLNREAYSGYAERLGLDVDLLNACIDAGGERAEVEADARAAAALGVNGTPTFFINGIPLIGAQPLAQFRSVIDGELNP